MSWPGSAKARNAAGTAPSPQVNKHPDCRDTTVDEASDAHATGVEQHRAQVEAADTRMVELQRRIGTLGYSCHVVGPELLFVARWGWGAAFSTAQAEEFLRRVGGGDA